MADTKLTALELDILRVHGATPNGWIEVSFFTREKRAQKRLESKGMLVFYKKYGNRGYTITNAGDQYLKDHPE